MYAYVYSLHTVNVNLGDVTLDLLVNDTRIGYTMLKNLTVNSGDNAIDCMTYYAPRNAEERAAGDYMLSNSVNGLPTQMVMRGNANTSTTNRLLAATIGDLQLTAPLPGLEKPLVESATLRVNPFTVFNTDQGETSFEIDNYLDESFAFDALNMRISYKQSELATLDLSLRNTTDVEGPRNVTVPAHETLETEFYPVSMTDASSMQSLLAAAKGTVGALNVNATGTISAYIGQYHLVSAYNQVDLPTFVRVI